MGLLKNPAELKAGGLNEARLSSINHLISQPYFQRMWVVQECVLDTSIHLICGPDDVVILQFTQTPLEILFGPQTTAMPVWLKHSDKAACLDQKKRRKQSSCLT